jgi:hypothetical protein
MTHVQLPKPVRKPDGWWIPRCPPHYTQACGPYETRAAADEDRVGMEQFINSPDWRSHMMDLAEEEEGLI